MNFSPRTSEIDRVRCREVDSSPVERAFGSRCRGECVDGSRCSARVMLYPVIVHRVAHTASERASAHACAALKIREGFGSRSATWLPYPVNSAYPREFCNVTPTSLSSGPACFIVAANANETRVIPFGSRRSSPSRCPPPGNRIHARSRDGCKTCRVADHCAVPRCSFHRSSSLFTAAIYAEDFRGLSTPSFPDHGQDSREIRQLDRTNSLRVKVSRGSLIRISMLLARTRDWMRNDFTRSSL